MTREALFWLAAFWIVYVYVGYPVVLVLLAAMRSRTVAQQPVTPLVTIVTAAFNERRHIAETLENKLRLDYPPDRLEIIVVSDESVDGTDEIVRSFEARGVKLIRQQPRQGKTAGLNLAIPQARGEIIVFSDANSLYAPDALRHLVANFADPGVGYVTGKMIYVNADGSLIGDGCSAYMKYENVLRALETRVGSVVGVDGGIDAVRRSLYAPMRPDQLPDFVLPLHVVEQGYRVVYEPRALLKEHALSSTSDEFRMRVRVSLRSFWALWSKRRLLAPWTGALFAWQLWSHKLLRYTAFIPLSATTVLSVVLAGEHWVFAVSLAGHAMLLLSLLLAAGGGRLAAGPLRYGSYFVLINAACAVAAWRFLRAEKQATWQPRGG
jgi:cellulose synthase/poly-beta-1,6-N-acetylglucosamine synthase-like glycosyltransferase